MTLQITPEEIARSRAGTAPKRKPSKRVSKEGVTSPPPEEAPKAESAGRAQPFYQACFELCEFP